MAFLMQRWDTLYSRFLFINGDELFDVTFTEALRPTQAARAREGHPAWLTNAWLRNYQGLPNFSPFALRRALLRDVRRTRGATRYPLGDGGFWRSIVDAPALLRKLRLRIGFVQIMNTDYEIPKLNFWSLLQRLEECLLPLRDTTLPFRPVRSATRVDSHIAKPTFTSSRPSVKRWCERAAHGR